MDTAIHITQHAIERASQRLGLCAKALRRTAPKALSYGISHADTTGSLRRFLDALYLSERNANQIRVYGEHVWLFHGERLITILHLPHKLKTAARKAKERKQ